MRVHRLSESLLKRPHAYSADDHFRQHSFLALVVSLAVCAWLWLGQSLQLQHISSDGGIALMGIIIGVIWPIYRLHRTHYVWAVRAFLAVQILFIAAMVWLRCDLTFGYLFVLAIVAGASVHPTEPFVIAACASVVELAIAGIRAGSIDSANALAMQILLYFLAAAVSSQAARGLYEAADSAERSAQDATRHAEEARQRRAELYKALKSLDLAWAQLQRANSELFYAREAADAALRFKSEFAAQISHELRTSLNLVLGFSETMAFSQESYGVKLPAPYLRDVTEIYRNSQHLLALIDDVLDLSKLEAGRMGLRREPVDLGPMLREATDIARPLIETKGLELALDLPPTLPALMLDRTRLRQVVLNLLSNAVRATTRGRIVVRAVRDGDEVVVQVSDTGIGISRENVERVFEEFHQVDAADGSSGAAGLGLAVSKRIVALHGGRMWAESEVGVGSTFALALPLPEGPAYTAAKQTPRPAPSPPQPAVVVIGQVETDEVKLLHRHLEGYTVLAASTWEAAMHLATRASARAIIVNSAVTETPNPPPAPLPVPLIACPLPGPKRAQRMMGVACFLQKPIASEAIRGALREAAPAAKSLLLVDDDPSAVRLVERMLGGTGTAYQMFRAYSGREALARIRAQRPDAIVLDLAMADGNGAWLISTLREDPSTADIPVIVATGRPVEEMWQSGPIGIVSGAGFTPTETLHYLQAILSAVPPATTRGHTTAPLS